MSYESQFPVSYEFSLPKEDIVTFAKQYDPQSFHLDEDLAKESVFGSLVASGLQGIHKIWDASPIDHRKYELIAGLGFTVKFYSPIFPDTVCICEQKIINKKDYKKIENSYIYTTNTLVKNISMELIFELESNEIIREN